MLVKREKSALASLRMCEYIGNTDKLLGFEESLLRHWVRNLPKDISELSGPAVGSGMGTTISSLFLNTVRGESMLINQLLSNAIAFSVFVIGGFFLATAIGQYVQQEKANRKYSAGVSFASTQVTDTILPFALASFLLNNEQNQSLLTVANNYVVFMFFAGLISLSIALWILRDYVR